MQADSDPLWYDREESPEPLKLLPLALAVPLYALVYAIGAVSGLVWKSSAALPHSTSEETNTGRHR